MSSTRRGKLLWPGALFGLIGASVGVHAVMVFVIAGQPTLTLDMRGHYRPAWWGDIAATADARDRGWSVDLEGRMTGGAPRVVARLRDPLGEPIRGARVELRCFPKTSPNDSRELVLVAGQPGEYHAEFTGRGTWDGLLLVEHEGSHWISRQSFVPIPPPPPGAER
ncbi:MAG: hypothetical protein GC161_16065 [Planctomycetaceae bacterium]|nr:hypothetical protein [Planctomycetaceae bacterium]